MTLHRLYRKLLAGAQLGLIYVVCVLIATGWLTFSGWLVIEFMGRESLRSWPGILAKVSAGIVLILLLVYLDGAKFYHKLRHDWRGY